MVWMITLTVMMALVLIMQMTQMKMKESKEKWSEIECGLNPVSPPHMPFSFQFFFIAILFLIFDIEISMVLSFPMESEMLKKSLLMAAFLSILVIGLIYELQKGKIKWSNWMGK